MPFESYFFQAFIYLAAALVAVCIGKRFGLGAVLGYLLVGALIGPWGFSWIGRESEGITHFAEFGVVMMLFLVGLELEPSHLWRMRRQIFGLGTLQVILCAAALTLCAIALGVTPKPALACGLILAMSSTAIVLQCLSERGLLRTDPGQNAFSVLLFQDLAVIPIMAILPLLASTSPATSDHPHPTPWLADAPAWARALLTITAVAAVIAVARILVRPIFRAVAATRQREAFTAAALLLIVGIALLMTRVGLSAALGTFVAGVVLANSEYRHELESDLEPFKGLLLGLFFLGVGTGIDFGHIAHHLPAVLGGSTLLLTIKGGTLYLLVRRRSQNDGSALIFASSLAAGGEFAFVLITLSLSHGTIPQDLSRTLVAIVALTMAATPLLILAAQRYTARCINTPQKSTSDSDVHDQGAPVIICGFGRFGHAVGRLLLSQGIPSTILDNDPDQVTTLRSIGLPVFYGDASRPDLLATAGAARARILVITLKDPHATLQIVHTARQSFPHLQIFVRAWGRIEASELLDANLHHIYRDTLDSSLRMGADILHSLGTPAYAAQRAAKIYRQTDEQLLAQIASLRHDRDSYLTAARESQVVLEQVMRNHSDPHHHQHGWTPPYQNPLPSLDDPPSKP